MQRQMQSITIKQSFIIFLIACTSQSSVSQVSDVCDDSPSEGAIRYRLRKLDLETVQQALNDKLKTNAVKTVPKKSQSFANRFR